MLSTVSNFSHFNWAPQEPRLRLGQRGVRYWKDKTGLGRSNFWLLAIGLYPCRGLTPLASVQWCPAARTRGPAGGEGGARGQIRGGQTFAKHVDLDQGKTNVLFANRRHCREDATSKLRLLQHSYRVFVGVLDTTGALNLEYFSGVVEYVMVLLQWSPCEATCIGSKFGHQVTPLALV